MNKFIYYFNFFLSFIISFVLIAIFLYIVLLIQTKRFSPKDGKVRVYGIFLGMNSLQVFSISLLIVRYAFLFWCILSTEINDIFLIFLLLIGLIYNILNRRFFNLLVDFINYFAIYFGLLTKSIFYNYIIEFGPLWYVVVLFFLILFFLSIYSSFLFLKDTEFVIKQNNYIEKKYSKKGRNQ